MREIKFMAWDKEKKMWTNWKCYDNMFYFMDKNTGVWIRDDEFNRFSLIQYTGLKDRNGKEIYEGDIIRESDGDGGYIYAKVVYYKDGFMGKEKGFEPEYPISDFQNEAEVIGNIYENPELSEV